MCGSHSAGYRIYLNGAEVFEKCANLEHYSIINLVFVNDSTGFIVERNNNGHTVYKTTNSGIHWQPIGGGAPVYFGFYLVNVHTGYLVTYWNNPQNLYITRVSDINNHSFSDSNINQDTIINDTIFGESFCNLDTLEFKIKNNNDTIDYKIAFIAKPLHRSCLKFPQ